MTVINQMYLTVVIISFIVVFLPATSTKALWISGNNTCQTPKGDVGNCVPIDECEVMIQTVNQLQLPTGNVMEMLQDYHCGYDKRKLKICCPSKSVKFKNVKIELSSVTRFDKSIDHRHLHLLTQDCGMSSGESFISYGEKTSPFEFPWMALLISEIENSKRFICAGTIISDMYILTAAHCVTNLGAYTPIEVRIGEHDIASDVDCEIIQQQTTCAPFAQDILIGGFVPHPLFNNTSLLHDIALIRLAGPISFNSENVKPICLPLTKSTQDEDLSYNALIVTGWGLTEKNETSSELLKLFVPLTEEQRCIEIYNRLNKTIDPKSQICAGGSIGDSCKGDSGGPLQSIKAINNDIRFVQYGITSYGSRHCGSSNIPGVYTRVDYYMEWILDNMKP